MRITLARLAARLLPAAAILAGMAGVAGALPARAAVVAPRVNVFDDLCHAGLCWNDWSAGGTVRMYRGGVTNEEFFAERIYMCGGSDLVRAGCPNAWAPANTFLAGAVIIQVVYAPTGQCVGSLSNGTAVLTACNDTSNGRFGGIGTIQEELKNPACGGSGSGYDYNRAAMNSDHQLRATESGGGSGTPLVTDGETPTCWSGQL